jgi:hypothetical protein
VLEAAINPMLEIQQRKELLNQPQPPKELSFCDSKRRHGRAVLF